ncbi:hypothetical protein GCM10020001_054380 [Nonomuraea salmonea]
MTSVIALWVSERNDLRAAAVMLTIALASLGVGAMSVRRDDQRWISAFLGTSAISMLVLGWGVGGLWPRYGHGPWCFWPDCR